MGTPSADFAMPVCTVVLIARRRAKRDIGPPIVPGHPALRVSRRPRGSGPSAPPRAHARAPPAAPMRAIAQQVPPGLLLARGLDQGSKPPAPARQRAPELGVRLRALEQRGQAVRIPDREEPGIVAAEQPGQ